MDANGGVLPVQSAPDEARYTSVAIQAIKITATFLNGQLKKIKEPGHG
jgi:hypothetical protein